MSAVSFNARRGVEPDRSRPNDHVAVVVNKHLKSGRVDEYEITTDEAVVLASQLLSAVTTINRWRRSQEQTS